MQDLAVLLINLDSSSPVALEQSKRDKEIRTFLMDTAEKHPLDLILFQVCTNSEQTSTVPFH